MTRYDIDYVYTKEIGGEDNHILVISYRCPKCEQHCQTMWMYPEVEMVFTTNCCEQLVRFEPSEEFK